MLKTFKLISAKSTASSSLILSRAFAVKTDLPVKWIRPEKIPSTNAVKSGDLSTFKYPEENRFLLYFDKSEELKTADEMVKKMFTLEQNRRKESTNWYRRETTDLVRRHDYDGGSLEVRIAKWTSQIRAMQEYLEKFPRNKVVKVQCKHMIDKRKKFLRLLRMYDYRRFEWLIERLDILYRPYPEFFHWITRKESLRKLCTTYCDGIVQEKLDTYKKQLQAKQLTFLEEKIKNLEFIRNEQVECRVPITVKPEEIKEIKKQYAELKQQREEEEEVSKKLSAKEDYELKL